MSNPNSWDSGPPESKSEGWNFERRTELVNVASGIVQAQVMGAMRDGERWGDGGPLDSVDPVKAVQLAQAMIEEAERIRPKR